MNVKSLHVGIGRLCIVSPSARLGIDHMEPWVPTRRMDHVRSMTKLFAVLGLVSGLIAGSAMAQPFAPNEASVTMGHWHLNSRDV
jgi:hypothetical protein